MKMKRRERAAYKRGKREGYIEGYTKGLHDGNPFVTIAENLSRVIKEMTEKVNDPEFVKLAKEMTAVDTDARERFEGKCPYTGEQCEDWRCMICDVERQEREWTESNGEDF